MLALVIAAAVVGYAAIAGAVYGVFRHEDLLGECKDVAAVAAGAWPFVLPACVVFFAARGVGRLGLTLTDKAVKALQARKARRALPEARIVKRGEP
jgi:hypothetical protein